MSNQPDFPALRAHIAYALQMRFYRSGMTRLEVAEAAGVSRWTVNRYLRGKDDFKLSALHAICEALGITVNDVLPDRLKG